MSLSSFLLGAARVQKQDVIDKELDNLFRSTLPEAGPSTSSTEKVEVVAEPVSDGANGKKRKHTENTTSAKAKKSRIGKERAQDRQKSPTKSAKRTKVVAPQPPKDSESSEVDAPVSTVQQSSGKGHKRAKPASVANEDSEDDSSSSDSEGDAPQLVHESVSKGAKKGAGRKKKRFIPEDETPQRRDARTIFVGNVAIEVAKSRPLQKQLQKHILSFVPTAKIESVRFRSIAFNKPTAALPSLDGSTKAQDKSASNEKASRQHDRERAASWRATHGEDEPERKMAMTPKEKKRVAFIKHELHDGVDSVNAYVVFAHPPPVAEDRPANLPPPAPVMEPYEAARLAAERCDGSEFMERTLRVDRVGKADESGTRELKMGLGDPKATVFVGNLDFASKEQDLRVFFEGVVSAERGPPTGEADSDASDEEDEEKPRDEQGVKPKKPKTWVKRVRIIRDKDTLLGKGFAYVQFADRECVDEIIALEPEHLKFAKRKLRVQRCKTVPGSTKVSKPTKSAKPDAAPASAAKVRKSWPSQSAPKGDPALGTKISHLPKDERKRVKAADADRVARRMAKKKAKVLAEKGVKARPDRERVRKPRGEKKGSAAKKDKPKRRVRSGTAIEKLNTKK
ncbi:hypothetical protein OBBRIDRAFT_727978 [Obba rivulosa]|uniref:Nucleolar protein 12 n=1 Tax=Obba rivulosa TaxID=1052685 RepID=A0A8E2DN20_9APHY|nr:hypothetical protein OBBRIDRAFT_727978 [Obba rivulosa]